MKKAELMGNGTCGMYLTFDSNIGTAQLEITDGFDEIFTDINVNVNQTKQIIEGLKQFINCGEPKKDYENDLYEIAVPVNSLILTTNKDLAYNEKFFKSWVEEFKIK